MHRSRRCFVCEALTTSLISHPDFSEPHCWLAAAPSVCLSAAMILLPITCTAVVEELKAVAQRLMLDLAAANKELHSEKAAAAAAHSLAQHELAALRQEIVGLEQHKHTSDSAELAASKQAVSELQQQLAEALAASAAAERACVAATQASDELVMQLRASERCCDNQVSPGHD
jgi:predicted ATPase